MDRMSHLAFLLVAALCATACAPRLSPERPARCAAGIQLEPGVSPPKATHRVYPKAGRISGTELFSCLEVTVNVDGSVSEVTVVEPGVPKFDAAAKAAVEQWRYLPARKEGQPVAVRMRVLVYNQRPATF
jgi:TonB family protein